MKQDKASLFSSRFFIFIISLFVITSVVSYLYFKDKVVFTSTTDQISPARSGVIKKKDDVEEIPHRLYDQEKEDPHGVVREAPAIAVIEDTIRKYISPYGVRLLELYMDKEGIVYIDLGSEMTRNFKGDVMEEYNLIAGLYNSIKKAVPSISSVKVLIEGKEVESLGGHIDISRPVGGGFEINQSDDANRYL